MTRPAPLKVELPPSLASVTELLSASRILYMAVDINGVTKVSSAPLGVEWRFETRTGRLLTVIRWNGVPRHPLSRREKFERGELE